VFRQACILDYIAYLDEFGHIGPYVGPSDPRYNESPVFGLAGLVLPTDHIRGFGTWFYNRKCELLAFEIEKSGSPAHSWEKKGAALYTVRNVKKYWELRNFTNRFLNKIRSCNGFVFFAGIKKNRDLEDHRPNDLYRAILREAIKRLDEFCINDCVQPAQFLLVMDEHDQRRALLTEATRAMYRSDRPRRTLIEPPFQVESHRYQTLQAADWIAGLVGRLGAV
jgi:hypothetical protein